MRRGKEAVARVALAMAALVVLLIVGAAAYLILSADSAASSSSSTQTIPATALTFYSTDATAAGNSSCPFPSIDSALPVSFANPVPLISTSGSVDYGPMLGNFSAMEVAVTTSVQVAQANKTVTVGEPVPTAEVTVDSSYQVVGTLGSGASEVYDLNITQHDPGSVNESISAGVWANGTLDWVEVAGSNITQGGGDTIFSTLMSPFAVEAVEDAQLASLDSASVLQETGSATETLGPSNVNVTSYEYTDIPFAASACGLADLESFTLQTGTVAGSPLTLVASMDVQLSPTSAETSGELTLQVISVS